MTTGDGTTGYRPGHAEHHGPFGTAVRLRLSPNLYGAFTTTDWWLLTGHWHPVWPQFLLTVVSLADTPGTPPAHLQFPGATHELIVFALDPGPEPDPVAHEPATLEDGGIAAVGGYLEPVDVVHQFTATDHEMRQLAYLAAQACAAGLLTPSTDDAREALRKAWLTTCVKTLAHIRGEVHAP